MTIGVGQYIRIQMWNDTATGDDALIADGVLDPGADFHATFKDGPQTVTRWSLQRITKEEAAELEAQSADPQFHDALPSGGW